MRLNFLKMAPDSGLARVVLAVGPALFAHLLTLLLWPFLRPLATPPFLAAVLLSAWRGGFRTGLASTLLSGLLLGYFFILPDHGPGGGREGLARLSVFFLEGLLVCWVLGARRRAVAEASGLREQLAGLARREHDLGEAERGRLAREVHDELGQSLASLKMEIHSLGTELPGPAAGGAAEEVRRKLRGLSERVDSTISSARRIAAGLRPPLLDDLGLPAAIEWQTREFQSASGIACHFTTNAESLDLPGEYATAVYRVCQESLTNVLKHAGATKVDVSLLDLGGSLLLRVEDDGRGIRQGLGGAGGSLGLLGMRERARLIGGELEIGGGEAGTVVQLRAPLARGGAGHRGRRGGGK